MSDPIDIVVVGAFYGMGRRAGSYGALLGAAYDHDADMYRTVCKVGSGFTDEVLATLPKDLEPLRHDGKHPLVDSFLKADIWFTPEKVMEVLGDELTLSPIHKAGYDAIRKVPVSLSGSPDSRGGARTSPRRRRRRSPSSSTCTGRS